MIDCQFFRCNIMFLVVYTIRLSLSVAIIAMVNQTSIHHEVDSESDRNDVCSSENNKTQVYQYHVSHF